MKKTVPLKIEETLYEKAKWYRSKVHMTLAELIHLYIYDRPVVSVPAERIVMKRYKMKDFKEMFPFKTTTLQIEIEELERLLALYPGIPLNRIVEALLLDYVRVLEPNWENPYFDDDLFFQSYSYSEADFLKAYQRLIKDFPNLKQREYEKNRKPQEPNIYSIRMKYKKFSLFKNKMEEML